MAIKIAINGFGRIGRLCLRIMALRNDPVEVVAVNDLVPADNLAYLLKYDTVHRHAPFDVGSEGDHLIVKGKKIRTFAEKDPANLPWKELGVDYVIEASGHFTDSPGASKHLQAGAKRVIITAPGKGSGIPLFVMAVNEHKYNPKTDFIVSNASCTTNCLAPLTKILLDNYGIEEGLMTTIHSLTASQPTVDGPSKKDWRAGRSGTANIIPASTGAAKAVGLCLPEVQGKLTGMAFRIPTIDVSVVDLTVRLSKDTTYDALCNAVKEASLGSMKGIMHYCDEPVVSSDFVGTLLFSYLRPRGGHCLEPSIL